MIAIALIMMIGTTANADNWKSMNFRKNNSTSSWSRRSSSSGWGSSGWNYKGTQLNGVTHGGGYVGDRMQDRQSNAFMNSDDWTHSANVESGKRNYDTYKPSSHSNAAATGSRVRLVSSKTWTEGKRYSGGGGGGGQTIREYRYAPRRESVGTTLASGNNVRMNVSSSSSANAAVEITEAVAGPMRIGRDGTGGPGAANGMKGGQADEAPLGDGLLILLLMAGAMTAWKMKSHN